MKNLAGRCAFKIKLKAPKIKLPKITADPAKLITKYAEGVGNTTGSVISGIAAPVVGGVGQVMSQPGAGAVLGAAGAAFGVPGLGSLLPVGTPAAPPLSSVQDASPIMLSSPGMGEGNSNTPLIIGGVGVAITMILILFLTLKKGK